jgi:hypothetical protein
MATGATHFDWRQDVADLVARVEGNFFTFGNTYFNHPIVWPEFSFFDLGFVSVDFWDSTIGFDGISGRGNPISRDEGDAIVNFVWFDPNPPFIRYYIWQGEIFIIPEEWIGTGNFIQEPFGNPFDTFSDDVHVNHVHFTFW